MFPPTAKPVTHEHTLALYRRGLINAGLVRHICRSDDLLSARADRAGVPANEDLEAEQ